MIKKSINSIDFFNVKGLLKIINPMFFVFLFFYKKQCFFKIGDD